MSDTTIAGLRFRRVTLISVHKGTARGSRISRTSRASEVCDALICRRCTAVLSDFDEATRHLCVTRHWLAGAPGAALPATPDRLRERVRLANHATMTDLWPHGVKILPARDAQPLSQRYETLSVLFAEMAAVEHAIERSQPPKKRRRR